MSRPPLALLLVSDDRARLRAALAFARAEVALGGVASLFLQGEAAAMLRAPVSDPKDAAWRAAGEPDLVTLLDEALDDDVTISLCQSGLAMAGMDAATLDKRIEVTGPVAFLAKAGPDMRLVAL
jgi:predicted peroxiredoxin